MSSSEVKDNPYVAIVARKHRNLKKKLEKIVKIGESISSGKNVDEEQTVLFSQKGNIERLLADISLLKDQMEELSLQESQSKSTSNGEDSKVDATTGTQAIEQSTSATQAEVVQVNVATSANIVSNADTANGSNNAEAVAVILEASVRKLLKVFHVCLKYKDVTGRSLPSNVDFFGRTLSGQTSIAPFEEALNGSLRCAGVYLSDELAGQSEAVRGFTYSQISEFVNQLAEEMSGPKSAASSTASLFASTTQPQQPLPLSNEVSEEASAAVASSVVDAAIADSPKAENPAAGQKEKQRRTRKNKTTPTSDAAVVPTPASEGASQSALEFTVAASSAAPNATVLSEKEVEVKYNTRFTQKKAKGESRNVSAPAAPVVVSETVAAAPAAAPTSVPNSSPVKTAWTNNHTKATIDPNPFKVASPSSANKKNAIPQKTSTAFDENLYTKPVPTVSAEQMARAERMAREIERNSRREEGEEGHENRRTEKRPPKKSSVAAGNDRSSEPKTKIEEFVRAPAASSDAPAPAKSAPPNQKPPKKTSDLRASEDSDSHLAAILAANRPTGKFSSSAAGANIDNRKKDITKKVTPSDPIPVAAPRSRPGEERPARSASAPQANSNRAQGPAEGENKQSTASSAAVRPSKPLTPAASRPDGHQAAAVPKIQPTGQNKGPVVSKPSVSAAVPRSSGPTSAAAAAQRPSGAPRPVAPKPAK